MLHIYMYIYMYIYIYMCVCVCVCVNEQIVPKTYFFDQESAQMLASRAVQNPKEADIIPPHDSFISKSFMYQKPKINRRNMWFSNAGQ